MPLTAEAIELLRQELRLMREIAVYELQCLMDDGADADEIDGKLKEYELIQARRDELERLLGRLTT